MFSFRVLPAFNLDRISFHRGGEIGFEKAVIFLFKGMPVIRTVRNKRLKKLVMLFVKSLGVGYLLTMRRISLSSNGYWP
jgi:hypothetical protein